MPDTDDKRMVGHCYIARRPCGRASAMAWDEENPEHKKELARTVSAWIERGDSVNRVARFEGDPVPENIVNNRQLKQTAFDATHWATPYVGASWTVSAQRLDLCRIFTAAFTSRSSTSPHSQECIRSDRVFG